MQLKLFRILFNLLDAISSKLAAHLAVAVFYAPRKFPAANWEKAGIALGKVDTLHFDGEKLDANVRPVAQRAQHALFRGDLRWRDKQSSLHSSIVKGEHQ